MRRILLGACAALGLLALGGTAEAQQRNIRVSNGVNQDHPVGNGVAKMAECAAQRSNGRLRVQGFWGGALGGDLQATQALRSGTQEMVVTSTSPLVGILPALGVFDLPFLVADEKEADALLDGRVGEDISRRLEGVGLVNLAYWENGFRNATNSRRPIQRWEDFNGVRMRVMQNNIFLDTFRNMGANAVPMAFGEVYSALETRAIDGQENPYVTIDTSKMSEVQRYLSVTRHAYTPFLVLYSKRLWDQLSAEDQATLRTCAIEGRDEQRRVSRASEAQSLANIRRAGMQVNEIAPAELERMRQQAQTVYQRHAQTIGQDVIEMVQAELRRIRGQ
ncbi:TRAP transporter substrate-binding protein [Roseomonas sp. CCTCC AB2023176]|uniref:TRAP transporter substrate-binding protein n=1 Tax=Roseomonas sp. CCTCC AB2023176 TaxID=3342640 RepID=UPI0035DBE9F4